MEIKAKFTPMKQDDQKGEFLGSLNTLWAQWLVLSMGILIVAVCILFYLVSGDINYLTITFLIIVMWGGIIWLYSRLREVKMYEDKFIIRNLFGSTEVNFQDFEGLQKGLLPMILEIKFKGNRTYPFLLSHSTLIKGILSFNSNEMMERLSQEVNDHFGPGSRNDINLPNQE